MKKFLLLLTVFCLSVTVIYASDFPSIKYKNIPNKSRISYDQDTEKWINKVDKKDSNALTKKDADIGSIYVKNDGSCAFSTGCEYEFILDGRLIGFSNKDLKFYEFKNNDGLLTGEELPQEEVQALIPNYTIVKISDFSDKTNVYKIKKHAGTLRVLIFNDTDKTFENYAFSSGNAVFKKYALNGFIDITKKGMIEFSSNEGKSGKNPWYVLLVR